MPTGGDPPRGGVVVVDLGKVKGKRIKDLKRGEGSLVGEVEAALSARRALAESSGKQLVPIVVVVRREPRKAKTSLPTPLEIMNPMGRYSPLGMMRRGRRR